MSNGAVEKEVVTLDVDVDDDDVAAASARLAQYLGGRRLSDLVAASPETRPGDPADTLVAASCSALRTHLSEHDRELLYVGGASRLAAEHDAFVTTSAARLVELLEQHVVISTLMRQLLGPGLTVRIGSENEEADLRECSLVLAPYLVAGEIVGTLGVLGPTRMDYRKAQAVVATVSQQLGRQLSQ
jgi:heat-inducible transcriptional repressor